MSTENTPAKGGILTREFLACPQCHHEIPLPEQINALNELNRMIRSSTSAVSFIEGGVIRGCDSLLALERTKREP